MLDFIVENYYVVLVICILLIFAIIGYIIDSFKAHKYEENNINKDNYIPEEEVFIQKFEEPSEDEEAKETIDDLINEYNQEHKEIDSK